jgi:hypothetical protein
MVESLSESRCICRDAREVGDKKVMRSMTPTLSHLLCSYRRFGVGLVIELEPKQGEACKKETREREREV